MKRNNKYYAELNSLRKLAIGQNTHTLLFLAESNQIKSNQSILTISPQSHWLFLATSNRFASPTNTSKLRFHNTQQNKLKKENNTKSRPNKQPKQAFQVASNRYRRRYV
mmetsp:Transcript_57671/g.62295  ORF Transcript_57671/g.62295 Transcript_57671/m.62295 type:complete len:109 (+) Transcript_57671:117-443(+)